MYYDTGNDGGVVSGNDAVDGPAAVDGRYSLTAVCHGVIFVTVEMTASYLSAR